MLFQGKRTIELETILLLEDHLTTWVSSQLPACFYYWLLERLNTTDELPTGTHGQTDWFIANTQGGATRYLNKYNGQGVYNGLSIASEVFLIFTTQLYQYFSVFFLFAPFSEEPEVFLPKYSQTAILHDAHFWRVVNRWLLFRQTSPLTQGLLCHLTICPVLLFSSIL